MLTKTLGWICAALTMPILPLAAAAGDDAAPPAPLGTAVHGLRLSLSATEADKAGVPVLQFEFHNVGENDLSLNLGLLLANGKPLRGRALFPTNLKLHLTDAAGKSRELHFLGPNIAGRVDDYVVPLSVGSVHTLKVPFSKFRSPEGDENSLELLRSDVQLSAQFGGGAAAHESGKFILNYWAGDLRSNTIVLKR
jgi:hypothetical protein